jgi:ferredoxin-nitrate reductase
MPGSGGPDRIRDPWGARTPYASGAEWPVRIDSFFEDGLAEDGVARWVQSASVLHSNGDALESQSRTGMSPVCAAGPSIA